MKTKNNIIIFVAISLLLHVILFTKITPQEIILPADTGNIISITISPDAIANSKSLLAAATKKEPAKKKLQQTKPVEKKLDYKKPVPQAAENTAQKQNPPLNKPAMLQTASATPQTQIISLLKDKIKQHFYYPKIAQRQNWQGKVLLVFDINTHGLIKNITVKQSSGYSVLDNAAMNSLTKVTAIPPGWIKSEYYSSLKLTVKYRLEEG